jgi:hypothetical protein
MTHESGEEPHLLTILCHVLPPHGTNTVGRSPFCTVWEHTVQKGELASGLVTHDIVS